MASGPALIHFAVHYAESADFPLEELFFQVPEVADLFASTDISPHTAEAWSRDPFTLLKRFRDELERAERESPSNSNPSKYRRLSSRETAIIVARFLTYEVPAAAADAKSRDRLAARQQQMMELPDRETPGIRRFGLGRPRAGKGEFWRDFEAELHAYILETQRAARAAALTALPEATQQVLRYGERYADDLGRRLVGDLAGTLEPRDLYIERECETELVELMRGAPHRLVALSGKAGTGKSSVLWSLRRKLADAGLTPLLISATWMTPGGADRLLEVEDVVRHALQLRGANMTPVVLLDTADLLLHTEGLIYRTTDLLQQLSDLRIRAILTVRPREREQLRGVFERELGDYTAPELDTAVRVLMRRYFPKLSIEIGRDLVRRVETRGLPMTAVLRSPIQLRMLFDTSGGRFPGVDYDVTALYERYWATRIVRDDRGGRVPIAQDLSPTAGRLGILMVADATPIVRDRRVSVMLDAVSYPAPLRDGAAGMDDLARRGVLRRGEETWEFAHQTLFEFIAARALVTRNTDAAASLLLAHVLAHPYDLFTAAVLEQVVILLAREEATRPAARAITGTLIGQPHASLRPIGAVGWLHVPGMEIPDARSIDQETARRLLGHLPQVEAIDADHALAVLGALWRDHRDVAHRQLVACLAILVQRWPDRIGEFVVAEQIIPTLLATERESYRQSISLVQLALGVATCYPAAARDLMLHLLQELPEVTGFLRTMAGIAGRWTELDGGEEYAASVVRAAAAAVRRFPSRRRDLGVAAGGVVHALRHRRLATAPPGARAADWESFAADVFSRIGSTAPTIADAADLNAVARHLISADVSARDHVIRILDGLFSREPVDGPFQMVGSFLVAIVAEDGIARAHLVDLLHGVLADGLPATAKTGRTPAQRWAITARAALLDPDTPETFVAQVATGLLIGAPALWREPAYLLAAVFPAAIGGDLRARALLADVAGRPGALHPPSALDPSVVSDFLQAGLTYAHRSVAVAESVVAVAVAARRTGIIASVGTSVRGAFAIRRRRADIEALLEAMLHGPDNDQSAACEAWKKLQGKGLLTPTVKRIGHAIDLVRNPGALASLIEMLPAAVREDLSQAETALSLIHRKVLDELRGGNGSTLSDSHQRTVDAAFDSYRAIFAAAATPEGWTHLWDLVLRPSLRGTGRVDSGRFRQVVAYLHNLLSRYPDHRRAATDAFVVAATWAGANLSATQSKNVGNLLRSVAARLLPDGGDSTVHLLTAANDFPRFLGKFVVRTAVTSGSRSHVQRLLADGAFDAVLAAHAVECLRGDREVGARPIPELLTGVAA